MVDIKVNHIETPEEIARAIEEAESALGAGRVKFVHPDCGFWMLNALHCRPIDRKPRERKELVSRMRFAPGLFALVFVFTMAFATGKEKKQHSAPGTYGLKDFPFFSCVVDARSEGIKDNLTPGRLSCLWKTGIIWPTTWTCFGWRPYGRPKACRLKMQACRSTVILMN